MTGSGFSSVTIPSSSLKDAAACSSCLSRAASLAPSTFDSSAVRTSQLCEGFGVSWFSPVLEEARRRQTDSSNGDEEVLQTTRCESSLTLNKTDSARSCCMSSSSTISAKISGKLSWM